ncbi:hypothetical protein ABEB36_007304 [Hypothenemus hampei]|uniref:BTB domain-containing protein n=1 Tax=Hypothenemus hampei TaxID=57062 RepID=A0ABD1ETN1_HYPHA
MNKQSIRIPDCTTNCKHGESITASITKRAVTDSQLASYLSYICAHCESVKDLDGRTALHVASSCGRTDLVRWLVENRHSNINAKDRESGYTPLHRSIFYGKIDTTVELIKLGANLTIQDGNNLTFLEHAMSDRFQPAITNRSAGELFTWGPNSNNSLGSQHSRSVPESMDIFHKQYPNENVAQILINEFHCVILTDTGSVYSCGHGHGGRLGLGIQHTEVIPKPVKFINTFNGTQTSEKVQIVSCSIARDHSLFLSSNGEIFACGLNKHKVLGLSPPPSEVLVPKVLKMTVNKESMVATGTYHSLVWNKSDIFVWGLNAGQLGFPLNNLDKYITEPRRVKCISSKENAIKLVCSNTGATVIYTKKGDIYVLHEYQCRKISSKLLDLVQISVFGGNLNHSIDSELAKNSFKLKVAALTSTGNLLLWQESDPMLRRCVFGSRCLNIKQFALNINEILFVTKDGEAFKGEIKPRKKKATTNVPKENSNTKSDFHKFIEKDECISLKLERIPRVHRAVKIESDPKGQNYSIVQEYPYKFFNHSDISESTMLTDMHNLLTDASLCDGLSDVEFNVSGHLFAAHKFILSSRIQYFENLFKKTSSLVEFPTYHPTIFQEFLNYVYTGKSELLQVGELKNEALKRLCLKKIHNTENDMIIQEKENQSAFEYYTKLSKRSNSTTDTERKLDNPVRMLHEMSKRFECIELQKILSNLDMINYCVILKKDGWKITKIPLVFNRYSCLELCDVEIHCKDKNILKAHKCILAARLDYFSNMFSTRWRGNETSVINIPFTKGVVEALLEFLYSDSLDRFKDKDINQFFQIIILADEFFVTRLKEQCEHILSNLLTIKNAVQLLTFADMYNAHNLKENCFEFIHQNITSFLEMRLLDDLEPEVLKELSEFYQIHRHLDCRIITPYSIAASDEEIIKISTLCPVDIMEKREKKDRSKTKKRSRTHKTSEQNLSRSMEKEQDSSVIHLNESINIVEQEKETNPKTDRLKSILIANEFGQRNDEIEMDNFTILNRKSDCESLSSSFVDSFEFPLLNSPPKQTSDYQNVRMRRSEPKIKSVKISQKQRKRLSSESNNIISSSPVIQESPKNPWKIPEDWNSSIDSGQQDNIEAIISSEKKQKENLIKITSKQLVYTQIEDKAIEELRKFYNADNVEDEIILIERVSMGAVALPVWVPKTK